MIRAELDADPLRWCVTTELPPQMTADQAPDPGSPARAAGVRAEHRDLPKASAGCAPVHAWNQPRRGSLVLARDPAAGGSRRAHDRRPERGVSRHVSKPVARPSGGCPVETADRAEPLRLEPTRCCLCGHDDAMPVAVGEDFEYRSSPDQFLAMRCRDCGLVYLKLRPAAMSELPRIYPPDYHAFDFSGERYGLPHRVRRRLEARRLLRWCRDLPPQARDPGCRLRRRLPHAACCGSSAARVDARRRRRQPVGGAAGRARGLTIHLGTVQDVGLPPESYDLALLIATIEHVDDPLGRAAGGRPGCCEPGGRVLIVTDNTDTAELPALRQASLGRVPFPPALEPVQPTQPRPACPAGRVRSGAHRGPSCRPVNWTYSIHNALVDWSAPRWLVNRFTLARPGSLAVFTFSTGFTCSAGDGGLRAGRADEAGGRCGTVGAPSRCARVTVCRSPSSAPGLPGSRPPPTLRRAGHSGAPVRGRQADRRAWRPASRTRTASPAISARTSSPIGWPPRSASRSACRTVAHYGETVLLRGSTYSYPFGMVRNPRLVLSGVSARVSPVQGAARDRSPSTSARPTAPPWPTRSPSRWSRPGRARAPTSWRRAWPPTSSSTACSTPCGSSSLDG